MRASRIQARCLAGVERVDLGWSWSEIATLLGEEPLDALLLRRRHLDDARLHPVQVGRELEGPVVAARLEVARTTGSRRSGAGAGRRGRARPHDSTGSGGGAWPVAGARRASRSIIRGCQDPSSSSARRPRSAVTSGAWNARPGSSGRRGVVERLAARPGLAGRPIFDAGDAPVEPGWAADPDPRAKNRALLVENLPRIADHVATALDAAGPDAASPSPRRRLHVARGRPGSAPPAPAGRRLALAWFDAHGDFNTPATTPSGNVWGMPFAMACGRGDPDLVGRGRRPDRPRGRRRAAGRPGPR